MLGDVYVATERSGASAEAAYNEFQKLYPAVRRKAMSAWRASPWPRKISRRAKKKLEPITEAALKEKIISSRQRASPTARLSSSAARSRRAKEICWRPRRLFAHRHVFYHDRDRGQRRPGKSRRAPQRNIQKSPSPRTFHFSPLIHDSIATSAVSSLPLFSLLRCSPCPASALRRKRRAAAPHQAKRPPGHHGWRPADHADLGRDHRHLGHDGDADHSELDVAAERQAGPAAARRGAPADRSAPATTRKRGKPATPTRTTSPTS